MYSDRCTAIQDARIGARLTSNVRQCSASSLQIRSITFAVDSAPPLTNTVNACVPSLEDEEGVPLLVMTDGDIYRSSPSLQRTVLCLVVSLDRSTCFLISIALLAFFRNPVAGAAKSTFI